MFGTIKIPYESVMLLNVCKLKNRSRFEDAEMAIGEVCNLTKKIIKILLQDKFSHTRNSFLLK